MNARTRLLVFAGLVSLLTSITAWAGHRLPLPPANDNIAQAAPITLPFDQTIEHINATRESGEPGPCTGARPAPTVWYSYTSPVDTQVSMLITALGDRDPEIVIGVFKGGPAFQDLTQVACMDHADARFSGKAPTGFSTLGGEQYYIQVTVDHRDNFPTTPMSGNDRSLRVVAEEGGKLQGRVTDTSGTPLSKMCVSASIPGYYQRVYSATDGTYAFQGLRPGSYRVAFYDCEGLLYGGYYYGPTGKSEDAVRVPVGVGQTVTGIDGALLRYARILGTVTGPDGPASRECVTVTKPDGSIVKKTTSETAGSYDTQWLLAGTYKVLFGCEGSNRYQQSWYNGKGDLASADEIQLSLGQDFRIDHTLAELPPATNDDLADALDASSLPYVDQTYLWRATTEPREGFCGRGTTATVWYRFTTETPVRLTAQVDTGGYNASIGLYVQTVDTGTPDGLVRVGCPSDPAPQIGTRRFRYDFSAEPGLVYYLQIGRLVSGSAVGAGRTTFSLYEEGAPANDLRSSAVEFDSVPYRSPKVQMHKTSVGVDDAPSGCGPALNSIWYRYTASQSQRLNVGTTGWSASSGVAVFRSTGMSTGIGAADLVPVACVDNVPWNLDVDVTAGETYYFQVFRSYWPVTDWWPEMELVIDPA